MTLQEILDKRVLAGDGCCLGRVFDFRAEWQESDIRVTHLRVGAAAWITRLRLEGFLRWLLRSEPGLEIPWEAIASVERAVQLHRAWDRARCEMHRIRR